MLIVKVEGEKNIDAALKTLKKKVQKTRLIQNLHEKKEYTKPSVERRAVLLKAKFKSKFKG